PNRPAAMRLATVGPSVPICAQQLHSSGSRSPHPVRSAASAASPPSPLEAPSQSAPLPQPASVPDQPLCRRQWKPRGWAAQPTTVPDDPPVPPRLAAADRA
ncbi:hypothetical protein Vretifemale_6879, partial [Volvox reticuliferus]